MALRIKLEFECEHGHWIGVTEDSAVVDSREGKFTGLTLCPYAGCDSKTFVPWNRRKVRS